MPNSITLAREHLAPHLLLFAAFYSDEGLLGKLLQRHDLNLDFVSDHFSSALTLVLHRSNDHVVRILVKQGANPYISGRTWPQDGVSNRAIPDPHPADTPIVIAATQGKLEIVKLFTGIQYEGQRVDPAYGHAMIEAAIAGHREVVIHLYGRCPPSQLQHASGMSLYYASCAKNGCELVAWLILREIDAGAKRERLYIAAFEAAVENSNEDTIAFFISHGVTACSMAPFASAAASGNEELLDTLVQKSETFSLIPDKVEIKRELLEAGRNCAHAEALGYLIDDVTMQLTGMHNLMANAIVKERIEAVRFLVKEDAENIEADLVHLGRTTSSVTLAYLYDQTEIRDLLLGLVAKWTPLTEAMWAAEVIKGTFPRSCGQRQILGDDYKGRGIWKWSGDL